MTENIFSPAGLYYRLNRWLPGRPGLVFIHGLSGSSSAWRRYEKRWENKYNLLFYDLRGHGKSAKFKNLSDYSIPTLANDLFALTQALGLKNFILVAHSFGGLIALEFIRRHQNLIKASIFLSPIFNVKHRLVTRLLEPLVGLYKILDRLPFSERPGRQLNYSGYINTGDWNLRRMSADIPNTGWRAYLYSLEQFYKFHGEKILKLINRPVLIISGLKDTIAPPAQVKQTSQIIKNSRLVLLKRANHIIVLNNFLPVAEAIENFINDSATAA